MTDWRKVADRLAGALECRFVVEGRMSCGEWNLTHGPALGLCTPCVALRAYEEAVGAEEPVYDINKCSWCVHGLHGRCHGWCNCEHSVRVDEGHYDPCCFLDSHGEPIGNHEGEPCPC